MVGSEENINIQTDFEIAWGTMFPGVKLPTQPRIMEKIDEIATLFSTTRPTVQQIEYLKEEGFLTKTELTPIFMQHIANFFNGRNVEPLTRLVGNNKIKELLAHGERLGGAITVDYFGKDTVREASQRKKGEVVLKDDYNFRVTVIGVLNEKGVPTSFVAYFQGSGGVRVFTPATQVVNAIKV